MIEGERKSQSPTGEKGEKANPALGPLTKRYYRVDEVAHYFSVSDRTFYRLIDTGDITAIRLRDCIRVSAEEIRNFEDNSLVDL
jgi:excisionase family DNA binding protein